MKKLVNKRDHAYPVVLLVGEDESGTQKTRSEMLLATRQIRKGPPSGWRTDEGVLLIQDSEVSPMIQTLANAGHLDIIEHSSEEA